MIAKNYRQLINLILMYLAFLVLLSLLMFELNYSLNVIAAVTGSSFSFTLIGIFVIFRIIKKDSDKLYDLLGHAGDPLPFLEWNKLNSVYLNQVKDLNLLIKEAETKKTHYDHLKSEVIKQRVEKKRTEESQNNLEQSIKIHKEFYKSVSDKLASMVWVVDYDGNVVYSNVTLNNALERYVGDKSISTIYDIMDISMDQFEMFRKRDFDNIQLIIKGNSAVLGKSLRIFEGQVMKMIMFISEISNQDRVQMRNYLKKSRDLHFINEVSNIISGQVLIENTLQDAIDKIAFLGNFNSCTIRLINNKSELVIKALGGYSKEFVLDGSVPTLNSHIGYAYNENKIVLLNGLDDMLFDDPAIKNVLMHSKGIAYIPLSNYNRNLGVLSIVSDYVLDNEIIVLLESISINVTIALEKILLFEKLKSDYFKTVEAFVTASEIQSKSFSGHSRRVAEICKKIAEKLYLSTTEIDEVYMSGLLHDIGKLASDNSNLENDKIDNHGEIGRKMVENVGLKKDILDGIEYHHLNYDLSNSEVTSTLMSEQPYYAQMIRLANDFDYYMMSQKNEDNLFVDCMKPYIGHYYSPQFMNILNHIIVNDYNWLNEMYQNEVQNEKL